MTRRRLTRSELRARLLDAGLELLAEAGTTNGVPRVDRVNLTHAIKRAGVAHSSGYRLYGNDKPTDRFITELLTVLPTPLDDDSRAPASTTQRLDDAQRQQIADELTAEAEALGLYDDDPPYVQCDKCGRIKLAEIPCAHCYRPKSTDLDILA